MVHSNPQPESGTQLERLTYELLDAHDDSARLLAGLPPDARREAQLRYLRDLQRLGREALARGDPSQRASTHAPTPENPGLAQSDAYAFRYQHCDIPPGLSIRESRALRSRDGATHRHLAGRLARRPRHDAHTVPATHRGCRHGTGQGGLLAPLTTTVRTLLAASRVARSWPLGVSRLLVGLALVALGAAVGVGAGPTGLGDLAALVFAALAALAAVSAAMWWRRPGPVGA